MDPVLEFDGHYDLLADPEPDPEPEPLPDSDDAGPPGVPQIYSDEDDIFHAASNSDSMPAAEDDEDPFGLFPRGLNEQISLSSLDSESGDAGFDRTGELPWSDGEPKATRSWDEIIPGIDPETKAMYEQWDEITHGTKDEPLTWLFEGPLCLPRPDDVLDESHAWVVLNSLLAAMALQGVAFDMCHHFTAMDAYRLLIEEILPEAGVHPNLVASGWVRHYSSWESCPQCDAEFEEDYKRRHPKD